MDRLGSSLDRALLLAELLRLAGQKVRLAHAQLTEEQAKELLPKLRPVAKDRLPPTPPTSKKELDQLIEKYAKECQLDAAEMRMNMDKASLQTAKLVEDVVQRVADQVPEIAKAVGQPAEKDVTALRAQEAAAELAALRDHWWVQRQEDGAWLDLDPLLPDAGPAKALAKARETLAPNRDGKLVLASKYCHEVNIRIVIEKWEKNKVTEHAVLEHALRPSEFFGERIAVSHIPLHWPKDLGFFKEKEPLQKFKTVVLAQEEWMPVLTVGVKAIAQSSFSDSGAIHKQATAQFTGGFEKGVQGLDPFKRFQPKSPDESKKTKTQSHLTAEWIDYEIRAPGQKPQIIRRQIFDLLGPAARSLKQVAAPQITDAERLNRGCSLIGQTEILPLACNLSSAFVQHTLARNLLANRQALLNLFRKSASDLKGQVDEAARLSPSQAELYGWAMVRQQCSEFRGQIWMRQPNIISLHRFLRQDKNSDLIYCLSMDIVANGMAVCPGSDVAPFHASLEQGIIDTNTEAIVVMGGCGKVENAGEMFSQRPGPDQEWVTIRSVQDSNWKAIELSEDARARIEQDLNAGYIILVPKRPIRVGDRATSAWWRVDPKTGQTLGMGPCGWGQAATEYVIPSVVLLLGATAFFAGFCIGRGALEGGASQKGCTWLFYCGFLGVRTFSTDKGLAKAALDHFANKCQPK